ncbi:GAF domain-containing protein, partial [candidate division WOR-3 bacterium]|nr:GAF domain-containing protein [candidate division WOR-3 bacterium]
SAGIKKIQIKYVFFGTLIGFIGGSTNYFLWYKIPIPPYLNILVGAYIVCVAYAIVRHQLMEIEVIIKKTLIFAGLFAAAFAIFVLPTLIIQEFIVSQMGLGGRMIGLSISAVLIILILQPIRNFLINITDKFLFQKKYDYKELLKRFSTEVLTVLDIDVLVHTTVDKLSNIIKTRSCGVLLLNETKNQYELVASVGVDKNWRNISLSLDNTLASFLSRTKSYLLAKHQGKDSPMPKRIVENMNKLKLELAIPLFIHEDMIGILTLGKKKSDEDYTQDDTDILFPLARTLAVAISNAMALDELKKTQAEAAQREKMAVIGTLSAGINHEICNPLGIARGQCEAFLLNIKDGLYKKKSDKELLQKAQDIMQKVIHETDRATATTKRLSSFAKPSKGLLTDDIDIKEEIDEVFALVDYEMKLDKIEAENKVPKNLTHITGDKKQIQEVFFNLIRNAAQAIQEKGKITINAHEDNSRVYVEIEDTGYGIPEDKLGQVFNPFYTTKDPGKGTGLGLFIVRQIVERNKGQISVESKVGEGTMFTLVFPIAEKAKV